MTLPVLIMLCVSLLVNAVLLIWFGFNTRLLWRMCVELKRLREIEGKYNRAVLVMSQHKE